MSGPLSRRVVGGVFEGRTRSVCGVLTWGMEPDPFVSQFFCWAEQEVFFDWKKQLMQKGVILSRPKRDTEDAGHLRTVLKLGTEREL